MSGRLPTLSAKRVISALERGGFQVVRTSGSHHVLEHSEDPRRRVIVPVHANRDLPWGTLRAILAQAGLSPEQLLKLL